MEVIKSRKGQAHIVDGLILLLITAICSVTLMSISSNYGGDAMEKYDTIYRTKLAQNTLLSLYHITENQKSLMAHVSEDLTRDSGELTPKTIDSIKQKLKNYDDNLDPWKFVFRMEHLNEDNGGYITNSDMKYDAFESYPKTCATAALTYIAPSDGCIADDDGKQGEGEMCYAMFSICVWQV